MSVCRKCEGLSHVRDENGYPQPCGCDFGVERTGPYHPNSAVGCATPIDLRTQALTGIPAEVSHGTLRGKMESQLVKELRAQVNEARAVAEQYGRELMDARFERDEALALLAEAVKSGEAT